MHIRISDSPRGIEILLLMKELEATPGFALYSELMSLNTSLYILDKNQEELTTLVTTITTSPNVRKFFLVENREGLHRLSEDVVRRLHNFIAAVASLRDHTRRQYQKFYEAQGLMPEYEAKIESTFIEHPLSQFVQKLRIFIQHYKAPHITYLTAWNAPSTQPLRTAIISKEDLAQFDEWGPTAQQYLATIDRGVDILDATQKYRSKVLEFYEWFQTKQQEIHADDLREFGEKEGRLLRLQLEDKLDRCIAAPDPHHCAERTLFFHVFLMADYEQLQASPRNPAERALNAIGLLNTRMPTDDALRQKLERVYAQRGFVFYTAAIRPRPGPNDSDRPLRRTHTHIPSRRPQFRLTTRWSRPGQVRRIGSKIGSKRWPGGSSRGRWAALEVSGIRV